MPNETVDISMDELFAAHVDQKVTDEASRRETLPTGGYIIEVQTISPRRDTREVFASGDTNPNYNRATAFVTVTASQEGEKKGGTFMEVSWEAKRYENGYLDLPSKLWGQACKALEVGEGASVGEVLEAMKSYPMYAYIAEQAKLEGENGRPRYVTVKDADARADYKKQGVEFRNRILSLGKVK